MTNRYSRTGTALEDGISGTRVMQPANNAIIQAPALPRLSRSNCSADKKSPSGNPAPIPAGTFHASAGVSTGKNKPGGLKRGRSFPKASSAGKSVPNSLGKGRFTVLWNRKTWKPAKRNYPSQQPARTRRQPSGRKRRLRRRKECSLPASAASPLPCIDEPAPAARRRRNRGKCPTLLPGRDVFWDTGRTSSSRDAEMAPAALRKGLKACTS